MPTYVRRRRSKPKPRPENHPLYDLLNELGSILSHREGTVGEALDALRCPDADLTGLVSELVGACNYLADLGAQMEAWLKDDPLDATALYARSIGNRRVMFLELVAWAIREAEEAAASGKLTTFAERLQINRMRDWLPMPWPGAHKDPDQFDKYLVGLGRGFTDAGGVYPLRRDRA